MNKPSTQLRRGTAGLEDLQHQLRSERAARACLESELNLHRCALDAATTHYMLIDVSAEPWRIVYVNRAICEQYGYEAVDLIGCSPRKLVCMEHGQGALARAAEAVRSGTNVSLELLVRRKDQTTFRIGMTMTRIEPLSGGPTYYVWLGADITARLEQERKQRELQDRLYSEMQERERMAIELRLAQKLESVGRLASGIAHEINTPIQYVGDSVSFLKAADADLAALLVEYRRALQRFLGNQTLQAAEPQLHELERKIDLEFLQTEIPRSFNRTLEGVERVATIVRALKEFAHPGGSQQSYADVNHALETTLVVAQNEYKYHAQVQTRFGELPMVNCNIGELNQVFLNLIVNAAHALRDAGKDVSTGRITITTGTVDANVSIVIEDNGCGIAPENLEKVFDPFFTTKPVGQGTGQGLALARTIVSDRHGGRISVHSVVNEGTLFTLHLPVKGIAVAEES